MPLIPNFNLRELNTFKIEARAKYFGSIERKEDLDELIKSEMFAKNKHFVMGGGSNVLFQTDFDGIIIHMENKGIEIVDDTNSYVFVRAQAGEVWDDFVAYCVENGLGGVENLSMIPGTVGASPVQNIGAYGVELKDVFHEANILNLDTYKQETYDYNKCKFGYRDSIFKNELKAKAIVSNVIFRLQKNPVLNLSYKELNIRISEIKNPGIQDVRNTVIKIRTEKLPDPEITPNAGSFFKNPVISKFQFKKLLVENPDLINFPVNEINVKLAAGQLIDLCGWKQIQEGKVAVHPNHALVIINKGNASGSEIVEFSEEVKQSVFEKFGVILEPEVRIL